MVRFNEADHTYWNEAGKLYTGATTLLGEYKNKFDTKAISERSASRYGGTPADYVAKWAKTTDHACTRGTHFHLLKETAQYGEATWLNPLTGIRYPVINQSLELKKRPGSHYPVTDDMPDGVYPEMLVWNHPTRTAGQTDWALIDDKFVDIDDWKTNKVIKTLGYFNYKEDKFQMMKGPLSHLHDCNHVHYSLQTSLYAYMIEQTGRTVRNLQFTHFPPLYTDFETGEPGPPDEHNPVVYPVKYMKDEIEEILKPRHTYL